MPNTDLLVRRKRLGDFRLVVVHLPVRTLAPDRVANRLIRSWQIGADIRDVVPEPTDRGVGILATLFEVVPESWYRHHQLRGWISFPLLQYVHWYPPLGLNFGPYRSHGWGRNSTFLPTTLQPRHLSLRIAEADRGSGHRSYAARIGVYLNQ